MIYIEMFHATLLEMIWANKLKSPNEYPLTTLPYAIIWYNKIKIKHIDLQLTFENTFERPPEKLYNEK